MKSDFVPCCESRYSGLLTCINEPRGVVGNKEMAVISSVADGLSALMDPSRLYRQAR